MSRILLAVLSILAFALAACGGDDVSSKSAEDVVKGTFASDKSITSGKLDLRVAVDATLPGSDGPLKLALEGPFSSTGKQKLPKFDFDVTVNAGGQSLTAGALSTGDKGFLKFLGQDFAVDSATFSQFKKLYEDDQKKATTASKDDAPSFASLGIDPAAWLSGAKKAGEESVGGADTVHVTAKVDVPKFLDDVNKLLGRTDVTGAAAAATGTTGAVPSKLTDEQRRLVEESVKSTTFDLYTGKDDGTLRRVNLQIKFDVPKADQTKSAGLTKGTIGLDLVISGLNEEQTITAPKSSRPLSELTQGVAGGATGASGAAGTAAPSAPAPSTVDPDSPQGKFDACLGKAGSSVAEAQKCAPLLNGR